METVAMLRIQNGQDRRELCAILAEAGYSVVVIKREFDAGGPAYDVLITQPKATP